MIRYEGPKGGPGMREMLSTTAALSGQGRGGKVALVTDGRFSGGDPRPVRRSRRARSPGRRPDRLVSDGDIIAIDADAGTMDLEVARRSSRRGARPGDRADPLWLRRDLEVRPGRRPRATGRRHPPRFPGERHVYADL